MTLPQPIRYLSVCSGIEAATVNKHKSFDTPMFGSSDQAEWRENVQSLMEEAVEFLREHEPPEGYFVGFSGGKDSIVTLELCRMAGVGHRVFYSATGIDPPELIKFIRREYPEVTFLKPPRPFFKIVANYFPPSSTKKWCCNELKKAPSRVTTIKQLVGDPLRRRLMGIRAEESTARAKRPRICNVTGWGYSHYKPIFGWKEWAVWEFIEGYGLPYPELYNEFDRIGCMFCPAAVGPGEAAQRRLNTRKERWPLFYKAFERACRLWWDITDKEARAKYPEKTFEEWLTAYYRGFK